MGICHWNNFKNQSTFAKVMIKSQVSCFWDRVYINHYRFPTHWAIGHSDEKMWLDCQTLHKFSTQNLAFLCKCVPWQALWIAVYRKITHGWIYIPSVISSVSGFTEKIASVDGPEIEIIIKCGIWRTEAVSREQQQQQQQLYILHCANISCLQ